jgi:hypothetical protein
MNTKKEYKQKEATVRNARNNKMERRIIEKIKEESTINKKKNTSRERGMKNLNDEIQEKKEIPTG